MNQKVTSEMNTFLDLIRKDLTENGDEQNRISGQRFFKEEVQLYGVKSALVGKIAKERFKEVAHFSKAEIFHLCELLWKSGMMEEGFIACNWSYAIRRQYVQDDIRIFQQWIGNFITNWATCDTLCNHSVGDLVMRYPDLLSVLDGWARSPNRWMRRAAAVSLIVPARKGLFLNDIFRLAEILLTDRDDMVQKGYGWMLKVASQAHQEQVFQFVVHHKADMPRTALRYAIEKLPLDLRKQAMEK